MHMRVFKVNIRKICTILGSSVFLYLLSSCAQVGSPSGGAKDNVPPKIIKSEPENFSANFKDDRLELTFDEYVQIKDLQNQLIISPPLKQRPVPKIKGKAIIIKFEEELRPNTTYSFNFGSSIVDINEGNMLDSNVFVFSTGTFVDSLQIHGTLKNATDAAPVKDIAIMLYDSENDSVPYLEQPLYITKTKADGRFSLNNLKSGNYRVFALKDQNNNFLYDQPGELIAFQEQLIDPSIEQLIELFLFEEQIQKQFLKKAGKRQYGRIDLVFNLPPKDLEVSPINHSFKKAWFIEESSQDTVSYWLTDIGELDSLHLKIRAKGLADTLVSIPIGKKEASVSAGTGRKAGATKTKPLTLETFSNASMSEGLNPGEYFTVEFSHPVADYDVSKMILLKGSDTLSFQAELEDKNLRKLRIKYLFEQDSSYQFKIDSASVVDIFNLANDSAAFSFKVKNVAAFGSMSLKLIVPESNHQFIVQLFKDKEVVLSEGIVKHNQTVKYEKLDPGSYYLKVIWDENNNGKWDTGNYLEKRQPEKVMFFTDKITVRSSWDLELDWDLTGASEESKRK
jgi:uncharacterized protein (DUF2141 family)